MLNRSFCKISIAGLFVNIAATLSLVSTSWAFPTEKGGDGWTLELGFGGEWESQFATSDNRQFEPDPYINIAYRKGRTLWYSSITDFGVYHSLNRDWVLGVSAGLEVGRDEDDDVSLVGLGNIDDTWELRLDLAYLFTDQLTLGARVMTAGADKDKVYFLAAIYQIPLQSQKFELTLRSDISWGSRQHLQTEFGVTPQQSNSSGYSVYEPEAGLKSIGAAISGKYQISSRWFSYGEIAYEKYDSAGSDSPFADNDYDVEGEWGIGYRF